MIPAALRHLVLITIFLCLLNLPNPGTAQTSTASASYAVQFEAKNVTYHFTDRIAVHIVQLHGHLAPTKPGAIVIFDDKNSFTLNVASAEIAISCRSLAQVLNENVFSAHDAPIKDMTIESKNSQLIIKGKLHQTGDVPFEAMGTVSADADGQIRLHADHVKAAHLPVKGLLDLLGIDLARLINTKTIRGLTAEKDDLILDPEQLLPPPRIQGKVTGVRVQGDDIIQTFGAAQGSNSGAQPSGNFMAFRHGEMQFGKLTMHDADLIMIDMDPRDPFDFFLDHYQDQLVAGYTKCTPEFGLRAYTRDYNKLRSGAAAVRSGK